MGTQASNHQQISTNRENIETLAKRLGEIHGASKKVRSKIRRRIKELEEINDLWQSAFGETNARLMRLERPLWRRILGLRAKPKGLARKTPDGKTEKMVLVPEAFAKEAVAMMQARDAIVDASDKEIKEVQADVSEKARLGGIVGGKSAEADEEPDVPGGSGQHDDAVSAIRNV